MAHFKRVRPGTEPGSVPGPETRLFTLSGPGTAPARSSTWPPSICVMSFVCWSHFFNFDDVTELQWLVCNNYENSNLKKFFDVALFVNSQGWRRCKAVRLPFVGLVNLFLSMTFSSSSDMPTFQPIAIVSFMVIIFHFHIRIKGWTIIHMFYNYFSGFYSHVPYTWMHLFQFQLFSRWCHHHILHSML